MTNEDKRNPRSGGEDLAERERELAQGNVPDRHDTGGGPSLGNTTDGRTGPGSSVDQGPKSTLRVEQDFSGDGNLANRGKDRDLVDFAENASNDED